MGCRGLGRREGVCECVVLFRSLLHQSLKLLKQFFLPLLQAAHIKPYVHLCFVACGSVECFFDSVWIPNDTPLCS